MRNVSSIAPVLLLLVTSALQAQTTLTFSACYVPSVGAIYMIKLPGLPTGCLAPTHVEVNWREGAVGPASGDLAGSYPSPTVSGLRGRPVSPSIPVAGQVLSFDGANWKPVTPNAGIDGPAGGDLSGSYPNPNVARLQGRPVAPTAPAPGQVLTFNGTTWVAAAPVPGTGGSAGGDLGGTYPNPTVAKLRGSAVSSTTPGSGQALVFNGTEWAPATILTGAVGPASGDLSGTYPGPTVTRLQGRSVSAAAPTVGQVLSFNGTAWEPVSPLSGTGGPAGGDLSGAYPNPVVSAIQGRGIAPTSPTAGQVLGFNGTMWAPVAQSGASGVAGGDLSGSYPNPTVTQLRGTTISSSAPATGQVLTFTGTSWAPLAPQGLAFTSVTQTSSVPGNTAAIHFLTCPAGSAMSPGWLNVMPDINLTTSQRSADGSSWTLEWRNTSVSAMSVTSFLYCAE